MQEILLYFVRMIVCTGILFLYYFCFLRDKPIHQYNRYFLLTAVLTGLLLPLVNISVVWPGQQTQSLLYFQSLSEINITTSGDDRKFGLNEYISAMYIIVAAILFSRLVISVRKIYRLRRGHTPEYVEGISLYNSNAPGTPFSFMNNIFWNEAIDIESEKGQHILNHEMYHVQQKHSLDLIFINTIIAIAWINPFLYLIRKELCTVHEYLADRFAAAGNDKHDYAELLVHRAIEEKQHNQLIHSFFHSQLKRRIAMILQDSTHNNRITRIMVFPLMVILFCSFGLKLKMPAGNLQVTHVSITSSDTLKEPDFKGGAKAWQAFLIANLKYPQQAQDNETQGKVTITFTVNTDGTIEDERVTEDPGHGLGEEGLRMIRLSSGKWNPAMKDGKAVKATKSQLIVFRMAEEPQ